MTSKIEIDTWFALDLVEVVMMIWYPWQLLNSKTQNRQFSSGLSTPGYTWGSCTWRATEGAGFSPACSPLSSPGGELFQGRDRDLQTLRNRRPRAHWDAARAHAVLLRE